MFRVSFPSFCALLVLATDSVIHGLIYDVKEKDYNLNTNRSATDPVHYWGQRPDGHVYHPSPSNWRVPFYTVFLDRFVNGDPENDNANGTLFETDLTSTQLRYGGDLAGLMDSLDYIQGMGIKAIYVAGSPFINQPWGADAYSPLDLTLLDKHFGSILTWQNAIDEIHRRGMYIVLDQTIATMGDLLGFKGYLNTSTPFKNEEHEVLWKSTRRYLDFNVSSRYNESCAFPNFWYEDGSRIRPDLKGCYDSDFDQFGEIEAFGVYPDWQRQLAKFASVQDRLREWMPSVAARLHNFACMELATLDIDGFRIDKAVQVTVDAQAKWTASIRDCALRLGKKNFLVVGEITSGNTLGSIYLGRGRTPQMKEKLTMEKALGLKNDSANDQYFVRQAGLNALDAGCFHYSIYRFLTRFLGLSGNLEAGYDLPVDWVETWNQLVLSNDFINPNTNEFDPRHLYGVSNQDVFRWPAIHKGTERMLLAYFITTFLLPGAPLVYYGEEQGLYIVDSTAGNYVFGRQAFSPAQAWYRHGCYHVGSEIFVDWPVEQGLKGCQDPAQTLDHRDPSAPLRNIMKHMFEMRNQFPVLEHGWLLEKLSNQTFHRLLGGSTSATEFGVWSVARNMYTALQTDGPQPIWFVYHNQENRTTYTFDCSNEKKALLSPFDGGVSVRNLFSSDGPIQLETSTKKNGYTDGGMAGCLSSITMEPFEWRVYVPAQDYKLPAPMVTRFTPGHDQPIDSTKANKEIAIGFHFSTKMDCASIEAALTVDLFQNGIETNGTQLTWEKTFCGDSVDSKPLHYVGYIPSVFTWNATLKNVEDGIIKLTLADPKSDGTANGTGATDHFLLRFGKPNNPIVFPDSSYNRNLLVEDSGSLYVNHSAIGATKWRYSTNFGSSWSAWVKYPKSPTKLLIEKLPWSGTKAQAWKGTHLTVQYWSQPLGSSAFVQHSDVGTSHARSFPHVRLHGGFNRWGYDSGRPMNMELSADNRWETHFMSEWPVSFQFNVWGINPDNQPDQTFVYGDVNKDGVIDRLPPSSLSGNVVNITKAPPRPSLSYRLVLNDAAWTYELVPQGNEWVQILLFILLPVVPVVLAILAMWVYMRSFYRIKINKFGFRGRGWLPLRLTNVSQLDSSSKKEKGTEMLAITPSPVASLSAGGALVGGKADGEKRTVLIATMEYNIDDMDIKIKIGGLGVMAQLMASALTHLSLVWVVPCVGDVDYSLDKLEVAEPVYVQVMGEPYEIDVYYHQLNNITYVILDAPIFRKQTKKQPYIARMDDIESAILYAAWNYCIAEMIRRFPIDIYHINDYHGAAAPLYLLPQTIPCCLSLHNAEFQGMWPMRTPEEQKEVCDVFNLPADVVKDYVQYGSVFNLLHAGASYLRMHQKGFGAVGVSKKYGDRSLARYPIFWALKNIGQLPNPDPSDTAEWDPNKDAIANTKGISVDKSFEDTRAELRQKAQEWAGLEVDPTAELFVFVGRWSLQKGVDLIADIFPSILEKYSKTQLICIGPVIDLYGKFAALKLEKLMKLYPKRVFSKPEFTQLPPHIFSGAEFALIPSRDEPFGLVAVEFGRKGALGVGARVGGLGQMPGFWFTVESMSPSHLLQQFKQAIESALACKQSKRQLMRAWSAKQRFPVAQWVKQLDELHDRSIRMHKKEARKKKIEVLSSSMDATTRPSSRGSAVTVVDNTGPATGLTTGPDPESPLLGHVSSPLLRGLSPGVPPPLPSPGQPWAGGLSPGSARNSVASSTGSFNPRNSTISVDSFAMRAQHGSHMSPGLSPPGLALPKPNFTSHRNSSLLSLPDVVGARNDLKLQQVDQSFNDQNGEFYQEFEEMLEALNSKNSASELCIETFLKRSEKEWFARYRDAKLGRQRDSSRTRSLTPSRPGSPNGERRNESVVSRGRRRYRSQTPSRLRQVESDPDHPGIPTRQHAGFDEFLLGDGYKAPTGLKKMLSIRVGEWPVYSLFLALAQVISVNSYQITLLTGETSQAAEKLYAVAATYLVTSIVWWLLIRRFKSVYVLSAAWVLYGFAFVLLGVCPFFSDWRLRNVMQIIATCLYAAGASSGGLSFALNFGDEGGSPTKQWIKRALIVTGVQQVYSLLLWYWGTLVSSQHVAPTGFFGTSGVPVVMAICIPVGLILWAIGLVLFFGLPDFYRQSPVTIPGFYVSMYRRKVVPWFFFMVIIQNYWLSAQYGRSWQFLFDSHYLPSWSVALLALGFSAGLWSIVLLIFSHYSDEHTWLLPIFAIGLCAPRWAQELWGVSGIAWYLPWIPSPVWSAILSRCVWLWLGLLDAIQGIGLGMMLLSTLTRHHVMAVTIAAQVIGSGFTMLARATAPNAINPNTTFPDFSQGILPGLTNYWFWICLGFQLVVPMGFFKFFRKEQVSKP